MQNSLIKLCNLLNLQSLSLDYYVLGECIDVDMGLSHRFEFVRVTKRDDYKFKLFSFQ